MTRPRALALAAVASLALIILAIRPAETARAEPNTRSGPAEEVRVQRDGDVVRVMRVTFMPGFSGDTDAVADGIASERGFEGAAELASSFAVHAKWKADSIPVPIRYNANADSTQRNPETGQTAPLSLLPSLRRAIVAWNSVPDQSFRFEYLGTTSADTTACSEAQDGLNVVRFHSQLPADVLGVTCSVGMVESGGVLLIEFDMEITGVGVFWSVTLPTPPFGFDLDTTVLHELGHALGLGHSSNLDAVMFAQATSGESRRVPTPDDIEGLRSLYGQAPKPSPTTSPSLGAGPSPPGTPPGAGFVITPNGAYSAGPNSIVVRGSGPAGAAAAKIASESGRPVEALWMLTGGAWVFFLPANADAGGGLVQFPGPFAGAIVVLG